MELKWNAIACVMTVMFCVMLTTAAPNRFRRPRIGGGGGRGEAAAQLGELLRDLIIRTGKLSHKPSLSSFFICRNDPV